MTIRNVVKWSIIAALPAALLGWVIAGMGGLKLGVGIIAMVCMTVAIIVYALNQIEGEKLWAL